MRIQPFDDITLQMELSGSTIRAYRLRLGMSQQEFAHALDLSQGLISLVEIGRNNVSRRLLRQLRIKSDEGVLKPTFAEFIETGPPPTATESELQVVRPVPLEPWNDRIDLRKPASLGAPGRFFVSGTPASARAYQFVPPPPLLAPDTVAVFQPATLADLARGQIVLVQFRVRQEPRDLVANAAHLGRVIVSPRGRGRIIQFEPALQATPVIDLNEQAVEAVMTCLFQGRFRQ